MPGPGGCLLGGVPGPEGGCSQGGAWSGGCLVPEGCALGGGRGVVS